MSFKVLGVGMSRMLNGLLLAASAAALTGCGTIHSARMWFPKSGEYTHPEQDRTISIREAARIRLRPILMTTLCTLFGLLPLALGLGAGSEMQKPLALAVIGGLALSTPITLFLVPTLLTAIRGRGYMLPAAKG